MEMAELAVLVPMALAVLVAVMAELMHLVLQLMAMQEMLGMLEIQAVRVHQPLVILVQRGKAVVFQMLQLALQEQDWDFTLVDLVATVVMVVLVE
jgi:hypothetical protein